MFSKEKKEKIQIAYDKGVEDTKNNLIPIHDKELQDVIDQYEIKIATLENTILHKDRYMTFWEGEYKALKKRETDTIVLKKDVEQAGDDLDYIIKEVTKKNESLFSKFANIDKIRQNKLLEEKK